MPRKNVETLTKLPGESPYTFAFRKRHPEEFDSEGLFWGEKWSFDYKSFFIGADSHGEDVHEIGRRYYRWNDSGQQVLFITRFDPEGEELTVSQIKVKYRDRNLPKAKVGLSTQMNGSHFGHLGCGNLRTRLSPSRFQLRFHRRINFRLVKQKGDLGPKREPRPLPLVTAPE